MYATAADVVSNGNLAAHPIRKRERLVRSMKHVLAVTMTEVAPPVETMHSLRLEAARLYEDYRTL